MVLSLDGERTRFGIMVIPITVVAGGPDTEMCGRSKPLTLSFVLSLPKGLSKGEATVSPG